MDHTIDRQGATDVPFTPVPPAPAPVPTPIQAPAADTPLPMPPGAGGQAQPAPTPEEAALLAQQEEVLKPERRVWISFVGENAKGKQRFGRMWLDKMIDIRSLREILQIETLIAEKRSLKNVEILFWKPLEA